MSKEKLKFTIDGQVVAYGGRPESRAKDLINILVKMNVDQTTVVSTFRRNIQDNMNYTDDSILDLFSAAQNAYAEKQKRKVGGKVAPTPHPVEQEKPQKLILIFKGNVVSYEGLPSKKQNAVIEFLIKQPDMTPELALSTFRKNFSQSALTDDEIWSLVTEARDARAARKAAKLRDAGGELESSTPRPRPPEQTDSSEHPLRSPGSRDGLGLDAVEEIVGMSVKERDSITSFIKQVLDQPEVDLGTRLRSESTTNTVKSSVFAGGSVGAEEDSLEITRSMRGKIAIYCQEENSSTNKVLHITPSTTFEEFSGLVEKKFERKMAMSFYEGDDIIDMDDDDVFCMFLEMSQSQSQEGKRMKLICAPPESRTKVSDDKLTDANKGGTLNDAKAFSNGRLLVKEERTFVSHTSAVYCCAFSAKGDRFCTASRDRSVRLWNTFTGSCSVMKGGHNGFVLSCDFSPRGNRIVSSSDDHTIKIWNTSTLSKVFTLKGHDDKVYCVQYNSCGDYIVSASCDHTLRVWNADSGTKVVTLRGHTLAVFSCCFSNTDAGKYVVSGGDDHTLRIWDWAKSDEIRSISGHNDTIWSCKFSNDDKRIVSSTMNHELKIWDWKNSACVFNLTGHQVPIHHVIFSSDDRYVFSCARDWTVMVWDSKTGEHVETIPGHQSTVYHMDIYGNKLLTSSLDDTLKLWTFVDIQ